MRSSGRKSIFSEINITPLTDIFLVLLIIMMVVAPMLDYPGLKLSVPSIGPDVNVKEEPKTVNIVISSTDQFSIDEKPIDLSEMVRAITRLSKDKQDGVVIQADPKASHNAMTQVMDAAQRAGITKLAVMEYNSGGAPESFEGP